ncbi:MAG: HAD-IIIC family phosphatase [Oscillospiraceae bacterium]|nr:HAD-IIIC family phosphatase [Oscillospiraceae bacterium]
MYKYACCLDAVPYVAQSVANILKSVYGKNKKVLALDLDDTLWGGVVGEDGAGGLEIGRETALGQVYLEFQQYCKMLEQIGVVLAVNSKNDMQNALEGLNHPDGVLRPDDFVSIKANWNPKDQNLRETAQELALGLNSFVFADDNPAEREIVKARLPEVSVPELGAAEKYINMLDRSAYFEVTAFSLEDASKTQQYKSRAAASRANAEYADYDDYLASLEMRAVISDFEPIHIQRIAQLTNKTNQFNLTTLRCSEKDIDAMRKEPNRICLCGRLTDKFGDNGIVSVVSGELLNGEMHIRLWLMSCRVLKRGLEDAMMNVFIKKARDAGAKSVIGYFYPTEKNSMVKDFYPSMGFSELSSDKTGFAAYKLDIASYKAKKTHIDY